MSIQVHITLSGRGLGVPAELLARLAPEKLAPVAGEAGERVVKLHLIGLSNSRKNALGGKSTKFYGRAARSVRWHVVGDTAIVSIPDPIGIRQRIYGGTIKPKNAKFLTIPVHPLAHGRSAGSFGDDLVVVWGRGGPSGLALRAKGKRRFGEWMYVFKKSVTQQPDPTVLPDDAEIAGQVARALRSHLRTKS